MIFVDGDTTTTGTSIPDIVLELFEPDQCAAGDEGHGHEPRVHRAGTAGDRDVYRPCLQLRADTGSAISCIRYRTPSSPSRCCRTTTCCSSCSTGQFLGALAEQNTFTNRPIEIGGINATVTIQLVIARANTPTPSRNVADRIRYVGFGNINPQEYFSYLDPVTYGHNSAAGAIGVAAYPFFAPFVPEAFTSPGPSTIYFDKDSRRLRHVEYPAEAGPCGDGRRQHDVLHVGLRSRRRTRSRTSSERARRLRMPRRLPRWCWMPRAGRVGQTQEDAKDPAGQRLRARPRSVLLVGLRAFARQPPRDQRVRRSERDQPVRSQRVHRHALRYTRALEPVDQRDGRRARRTRRAASCSTSGQRRCRHRVNRSSWVVRKV